MEQAHWGNPWKCRNREIQVIPSLTIHPINFYWTHVAYVLTLCDIEEHMFRIWIQEELEWNPASALAWLCGFGDHI